MWLYTWLRKIKQYNPSRQTRDVRISVIIACRNESDNLKNILPDIARQDYPPEMLEVIVVDDNSTDGTFEYASGFTGIRGLKVLKNEGQGKKEAITAGINAASGELMITTDADCRMGKNWIITIASFYFKYKPDMIICPVILEPGGGFFGKFQELEFLSLQGVTTGSVAGGRSTMCNGANLAFSREIFLRHKKNLHYELLSGDDVFFLHSLKNERGSRIFWLEAPEAIVTTARAETPSLFVRQRHRWISKGRAFKDRFTILLAIVTFVTIIAEVFTLIAGIFDHWFLLAFVVILSLKSIPDFLILNNTAGRYGKKKLLRWFIPSQLIYPFYVLAVTVSLTGSGVKKTA
jgi:cellulose synthase/poly-beta-1,6-N-acetylglucosamine synthase-like glycosyltransferase